MKIALIADSHFGARNDSQIFLNYFQKFYDEIFFPYLKDNGITTMVHFGDVVDRRKFINFVSLNEMKSMFFDRALKEEIDTHILIGNHDCYYKTTNVINSINELVGDYDNITIYSEPKEMIFQGPAGNDTHVLMIPWINPTNYAKTMRMVKKSKSPIVFGHLEIRGIEMYNGVINEVGVESKVFSDFEFVASGHFHHKSSLNNIHYLGNPYPMTWNDYNDPRGFHIFDTSDKSMEFVRNPYTIFNKLWYNDEDVKSVKELLNFDSDKFKDLYIKVIVTKKTNPYWFDLYLDKLYNSEIENIQIVDDHFNVDEENEDDITDELDDTITILTKYIDDMDLNINKKKLDNLMRSLYNEAINISDT